jgi:HSP90 family molecular chaperone
MTRAPFRISPQILRRLGEELNPSADQSILELVKNAYDADARTCTIELQDTDKAGGTLIISDTGDGMDASGIATKWLTLGRSDKSPKLKTRLGRVPAGSKGLGRLAALRMGTSVLLRTRPRLDSKSQYELRIDWEKFDDVSRVDEVEFTIKKMAAPPASKPGTDLTIENLKDNIGRMDVKRLARSLILLSDPFGDAPNGFKPYASGEHRRSPPE